MKALTLWQPWASLIAMGEKKVETRCWQTKYRGPLAIHAAAKSPPEWLGRSRLSSEFASASRLCLPARVRRKLPAGVVLCVVHLIDIQEAALVAADLTPQERIFGNYQAGRYAWFLELVEVFPDPVPAKGNRLLWEWHRPTL